MAGSNMVRCCTGLFSATQTEAVEQLARAGLRNPVRVKVAVELSSSAQQQDRIASGKVAGPREGQRTPADLHIQYQICSSIEKLDQLVQFLQVSKWSVLMHHACISARLHIYSHWIHPSCRSFPELGMYQNPYP